MWVSIKSALLRSRSATINWTFVLHHGRGHRNKYLFIFVARKQWNESRNTDCNLFCSPYQKLASSVVHCIVLSCVTCYEVSLSYDFHRYYLAVWYIYFS